ncbi:MAG: hypothetical protein E6K17_09275 [Methanobacteriota archaeon]|nr:MAG: hypothetical protein E6K17_09275 [Euryarchaeota archaeon]
MIQPRHNRLSLVAALLLVTSLATSYLASADPAVNDNGNGTKTAIWDFSNPANYTSSNVAIARNDLRLRSTPGSWLETSNADFAANGSADAAARVTNGSVRLVGNEANLVANGNFSQASNWTWTNGTAGTIGARPSLGTGEFLHATVDNSTQFHSMDTGGGWSGANSFGATSSPSLDSIVKVEGTASVRDAITLPSATMWAGISQTGSTWDFSPYNRLSVWLNTSFSGPGQLQGFLHLETGATTWNSTTVVLPNSWARVEFNFTGFGSNLTSIIRLDLRFTGAVVTGANVWIDDLWRIYRKTLTDTASISQTFTKPTTGNGLPGSVLLRWDNDVSQLSNVTSARLRVVVQNSTGSTQSWVRDVTAVAAWTSHGMDLSMFLALPGTYTIWFELQVAIDTHLPTSADIHVDNVLLKAPDYRNGVYLSNAFDAGSPAEWRQVNWTAQVDGETSISVETRSGSTPSPGDPTWNAWLTHASPEPIGSPNDRYLQFRVLLRTLNSSRTPTLLDIRLDYSRYATAGFIESLPFLPAEPLVGWRRFDATEYVPSGTTILFEIHSNGTWVTVTPGETLNAFPNTAIQIRASGTTANTSLSPRIVSMSVMYEYVGSLWTATLTPGSWSGNADQSFLFVANGYDRWGHAVAFTPTWETTDPGGTVSAAGVYNPHTVGTWIVRARSPSGVVLANATVTITPGSLLRLDLNPPSASAPAGSRIPFSLIGYDGDDNVAVLSSTIWSATSGTFLTEIPGFALLQLPGTPASVIVTARHGSVSTSANVTVTSAGTPAINGLHMEP